MRKSFVFIYVIRYNICRNILKGESKMRKQAGILFPLSSLPNKYGVGDLGENAYALIDKLHDAHVHFWQILPLHPLSYGNSPYQPLSSKAGDEIYLSLDEFVKEGLLKEEEVTYFNSQLSFVAYDAVRETKEKLYKKAFSRFQFNEEFNEFANQQWVQDYALYKVFKLNNDNKMWIEWSKEYKTYLKNPTFSLVPFQSEIDYQIFLQFEFLKQWKKLKQYANDKNIQILGDMPIYVGLDSVDVWTNQENFLLEEDGTPSFVAGVPPDYFSKFGQRWGNPIYNWKYMQKNNFEFWVDRLKYASSIYDIIRIDHFRAFDTYWAVPESETTAINGEWIEAPGYELFDTLYKEIPNLNLLAEDLGDLRKEVYKLRDHYHLKGMYVFPFHFNDKFKYDNVVVYSGTHDNDTLVGWLDLIDEEMKESLDKLLIDYKEKDDFQKIIHYCLDLDSSLVVIPVWDIMGKDNTCRFNVPGKIGSPNWEWRLTSYDEFDEYLKDYKNMIIESKR
jgi:4-alpha-glucanotransferase